MTRFAYKVIQVATVGPLAVVLVAACGSSKKAPAGGGGGSASSSAPSASTSSSAGAAAGTAVTATETEFGIALSTKTFTPGTYTFTVKNDGKFPHNLTVEGPGVDKQASPKMAAGESGTLTVTLQKGSYELWCSVDAHKDKGMDMKIQVG
jgi:uncharacterized cupredoxin-like copper-binding protein